METRSLISLVTAGAFLSSLLYLTAYWGYFGINVFAFVSVADVISLALLPLSALSIAGFMAFLLALGLKRVLAELESYSADELTGNWGHRLLGVLTVRIDDRHAWPLWLLLIAAFIFLNAILLVATTVFVATSVLVAGLVFAIALSLARREAWMAKLVPDPFLRVAIVTTIGVIPFLTPILGLSTAARIADGLNYSYVESTQLKTWEDGIAHQRLRYIGKAGDYFFFLGQGRRIHLTKYADFKSLYLESRRTGFWWERLFGDRG